MQIYPAIDLCQNKCVRLYQGKFDQVTTYEHHPILVAKQYAEANASWLHLVDLDAAKQSEHHHLPLIKELVTQTALNIQVGGGIRDIKQVENLLAIGVKRVVIGSMAVQNPELIQSWLNQFDAEQIVIAVDVFCEPNQMPMIATHGWQQKSTKSLWQLLADFQNTPLKHILCTDISRDGTLTGPNVALYQQCQEKFPNYDLQASGGVSELNDLVVLHKQGLSGVIIGKALYEERFSLNQAFEVIG